jgi:hypothetical protein
LHVADWHMQECLGCVLSWCRVQKGISERPEEPIWLVSTKAGGAGFKPDWEVRAGAVTHPGKEAPMGAAPTSPRSTGLNGLNVISVCVNSSSGFGGLFAIWPICSARFLLAPVRGLPLRTRTRTNTRPYDTKASATGWSWCARVARVDKNAVGREGQLRVCKALVWAWISGAPVRAGWVCNGGGQVFMVPPVGCARHR